MMIVCVALTSPAVAGATEIPIEAKSDRNPSNFDIPKDTKIKIDGAHTFVNGVILGSSFELTIDVGSGEIKYDLETTLGYKWKVNDIFSLRGSAGVGGRFQPASAGRNFPYYVLYIGSDIDLNAKWTWNFITFRFRDAFDTNNSFNTPEVSTRLTFKIDDGRSVFATYYYDGKKEALTTRGSELVSNIASEFVDHCVYRTFCSRRLANRVARPAFCRLPGTLPSQVNSRAATR